MISSKLKVATLAAFLSGPLYADVSINIGLPPPPVVTLSVAPPMVWLPGPRLYVAHGSPQPIFFISGQYYLLSDGAWYVGPGYAGPWGYIKGKQVPPGLRNFHANEWKGYQRDAQKQRGNGKTFQAKGGNAGGGKAQHTGGRSNGGGGHGNGGHGNGGHGKGR